MNPKSSSTLPTAELSAAKKLLLEKRLQGSPRPASTEALGRMPRPELLPLSFAQQRLWFLDQLAPGDAVYNIFEALRIKGPLNVQALEKSLQTVVQRHEALRTVFTTVEGQPIQIIKPEGGFKLAEIDLRALPPRKQEEAIERLTREEAARPFDLTVDFMLRATLIQMDGEEHVLMITMHHIASDGWSMGVLYRELSFLYKAAVAGQAAVLPSLPIQYADYALWQRQWLQGPALARQVDYWKKQLAGSPEVLELLTDRPRPPVQTFKGATQRATLPLSLARGLNALCRQEGATLYMTLLAAWATLLHRYSRQSDIVIGSPLAGRNQTAAENLIGFFINTLALRTDLSGQPTFKEFLSRVRKVTLDAYAHQDVPFDKLVMELQPERSTSHSPIFQVMFALQSAPGQRVDLAGLTVHPMEVNNGTAKFDLTLSVTEVEHGLALDLEYSCDLFDASTVTRMLEHYQTLLEGIVAHPEQRISELPIMTAAERHHVVVEWNQTQADYPRDTPVHVLFEQQATAVPDAIALQYERQLITYRELNARANQLAHFLKASGAKRDMCIGVYLERTPDLFISLLAILKVGAAYLPLDRSYPKDRIAFMLEDTSAPLLITETRFAGDLPASPTRCLFLDKQQAEISRHPRSNLDEPVGAESLAYVIYTSGSTGRPKGACIPHRAINRLVINSDYVQFAPGDFVAQASNASFDAATFEIWGALLNGGRLVVMTRDVLLSPKDFADQLRRQRISTLFLTTSVFNLMAREVPGAFAGLKYVVYGGEAADPKSVREVLKNKPPQHLINGYGPTETTTFAAWYEAKDVPENARSIPIGRPLANTELYILDELGQPVPIGVPGELYIGGDGVGRGYWNRPELTANRFVSYPFTDQPGVLYRSGDLVRYLSDGNIEYLGRMDLQVKIRGFRIELGEIEALLSQHPAVRQAAVTVREDVPGDKRLIAYVASEAPAGDALRDYLKGRLPEYMVPSVFVRMASLPINANGKVNRGALPAPDQSALAPREIAQARDGAEKRLIAIWESVLKVSPIGITDKFFHLGGHSLLAVKLVAEIEKAFDRKISVSDVFRAPTVQQMAVLLRGGELAAAASSIIDLQPHGAKSPLFVVHGVGGGMFWGYQNLSRYLGSDQPVYVIRSKGKEAGSDGARIESMAAEYVADLKAFQPQGPYYLGGYCFGGNLAYEMARQLTEAGDKVVFVGLLNAAPPNSSYTDVRWTPPILFKSLMNLARCAIDSRHWTAEERRRYLRTRLRNVARRFKHFVFQTEVPESDAYMEDIVDVSQYSEEQRKLWSAHVQALIRYRPEPFPGCVHLFRSTVHQSICSFDPQYGWGDFAKEVQVRVVPGPHDGIMDEPHVQAVAREFKACIEKAQEENRSATGLKADGPSLLPPPAPGPATDLSEDEKEIWNACAGEQHPQNVCHVLRLSGGLSPVAMERAVSEAANAHEAMRSQYLPGPVKRVVWERNIKLSVVEVAASSPEEREAVVFRFVQEQASKQFDVAQDALARITLLRMTSTEHMLVVVTHPLAAVNLSPEQLLQEVARSYSVLNRNAPPSSPETGVGNASSIAAPTAAANTVGHHPLEVLMDNPRPLQWTGRRETKAVIFKPSLSAALRKFSAHEGISLAVIVLAAFGILVSRTVREEALVIRTKIGQRAKPLNDYADMSLEFRSNEPLREFLRHIQTTLEAFAKKTSEAASRLARNLFDGPPIALAFDFAEDVNVPQFQGLATTIISSILPAAAPLALLVEDNPSGLQARLEYSADHFRGDNVQRILQRLQAALDFVAGTPQAHVADVPLMTPEEREQVLVRWNETAADLPTTVSWPELFDQQVSRTPNALAVLHGGTRLTYRELQGQANHLANRLRSMGIQRDSIVALALERSTDYAVAAIATLKAGGAFLPLDLASPRERLAALLADAQPKVILAHPSTKQRLPSDGVSIVLIDGARESSEEAPANPGPGDLAYVMYTSGSTGKPKGVQITHQSLINHNYAVAKAFNLSGADRVLQFSALSFDISIEELFPTWLTGAAVVFRDQDLLESMDRFFEFIFAQKISVVDIPTAFWHELVHYLPLTRLPDSLRLVVIGGEPAARQHFLRWKQYAGNRVRLINTYGPTEATVTATIYEARPDDKELLIGRPIANARAYVLDEDGRPVPVGVPGELYLGGAGLARGYLNSPQLTEARFKTNPFLPEGAGRLYKTGDQVRWREDGNLEFIGRVDRQVKIRGYRVELSEIETTLREFPGVRDAVVLSDKAEGSHGQLTACVVGNENFDEARLKEFLKERLPDYMVPAEILFLDQLPRNVRGKIDRELLAKLPRQRRDENNLYVAPRNAVETQIATIWTEVLGLEHISMDDNFFQIGGHSLHAMQVVARLRALYGEAVAVADVFEHPTVATLAAGIFGSFRRRRSQENNAIAARPRGDKIPLSFSQQRMWFLHQLAATDSSYHIPQAIRMRGALDGSMLEQCLNELVRRHEPLRTVFRTVDGQPAQSVLPAAPLPFVRIALSGASQDKITAALEDESRKPFDLSRDIPVRAALFEIGPEEHILLLTLHHVAGDAWTMGILLRELAVLYENHQRGTEQPLPPLSLQYADYAAWLQSGPQAAVQDEQISYWKTRLQGAPALLELPSDRSRPAVPSRKGARHPFAINARTTAGLKKLAEAENCTLYMVLLASFKTLLLRYTGREDLVLGSPVANRSRPEFEPLVGLFVNTLVLRTDAAGNPAFKDFLARVRETTLDAYSNQDAPFERVVEALQPARDPSYHPLFQVMMVLQNAPSPNLSALGWSAFDVNTGNSKFDLTLELNESGAVLEGWIEYATDLFDFWRIERMSRHFETLLDGIIQNPEATLAELPLLPEDEKRLLMSEWNSNRSEYPRELCIHNLFETQALRAPERIAVVFGEQALTYKELERRAEQLADVLRSLGVGPDVLSAICMERSLEMIVAILGVLKAGGAYVPMDPAYPAERLGMMMEDARPAVLITQQRLLSKVPSSAAKIICLDDSRPEAIAELGSGTAGTSSSSSSPHNLAYVIYTSGSTGRPKGVAIEHRSAVAFLHWARDTFNAQDLSGVLFVTSVCFDLSIFEMFAPLSWGGKVILADNALEWSRLPSAREVTMVNTVPSLVAEWLRGGNLPSSVTTVNLAGEPLPQTLVDKIFEQCPSVTKVNDLYGPTEATVYSTHAVRTRGGQATIGRPLTNEQAYILDGHRQLVPVGVAGELYIGGDGLAREYLRRPELTADRFVPNPFVAGQRLYRTGDLARYRPDGQIEFLGRIDHQVKIRGYRIELGEIDARLRQHENIREVITVASPDKAGEKRLVAYIVAKKAPAPGVAELRAFLKQGLPDYMVPAAFVTLEALPLTANGKVDRKALPAPDEARASSDKAYIGPSSMTEDLLAKIWAEVLGVARVGAKDNFFELGGHSLLITKIFSRLREAIDVELPMRVMFEAPTVEEMAKVIESKLMDEIDQLSEEEAQKLDAEVQLGPLQEARAQ